MLLPDWLIFLAVFIIGELIALPVFGFVKWWLDIKSTGSAKNAISAGIIERLVLFVGLLMDISQVVIMFGALKIGTMVVDKSKPDERPKVEYFLIGNFISVLLVLCYFFIYDKCTK